MQRHTIAKEPPPPAEVEVEDSSFLTAAGFMSIGFDAAGFFISSAGLDVVVDPNPPKVPNPAKPVQADLLLSLLLSAEVVVVVAVVLTAPEGFAPGAAGVLFAVVKFQTGAAAAADCELG